MHIFSTKNSFEWAYTGFQNDFFPPVKWCKTKLGFFVSGAWILWFLVTNKLFAVASCSLCHFLFCMDLEWTNITNISVRHFVKLQATPSLGGYCFSKIPTRSGFHPGKKKGPVLCKKPLFIYSDIGARYHIFIFLLYWFSRH